MTKQPENAEFLFDSRIVQRNMRDGRVTRSAYDKHITSLPDLRDKCEDIGDEIYGTKRPGLALTGEFTSSEQDEE
jgi:hypothetical protein